jgi:hypothetical protein
MKKGVPWASPSFDACTSWIFLGVTWASPSLSFCPSFISSHHSLPTLENFLHTKLHTILISNISVCKIVDPNTFKSNPLPMKNNLVKKQVMKAQSNKHRKAKQVQLQDFQHKEGKVNIIEMHKTMFPSHIINFSSIMNKINNITIT